MMVKAVIPRHFSICVFTLTQVALDVEVLWNGIRHGALMHGVCHTYGGASVMAGLCFLGGKPASQLIKAAWNRTAARAEGADLSVPGHTSWLAAFTGAALGAHTHIVLDSIMHGDMEPLQPWSAANPLFGAMGEARLDTLCLVLGLLGLAVYFARRMRGEKI
jgi:hypothetical protein